MIRIQPLITDDGNRRALASLLDQQYTVETGDDLLNVDAYLVDDRSLPDYRDELVARKDEAEPAFVPVLLLRREDTHINVELPEPGSGDTPVLVDDIVPAPVDGNVLFQRLSNLLVRREQSLSLAQQYRQTQADFRALFQAIPDPAFVVGDDDTVTEANEEFREVVGAAREDVIGTDPRELDVFDDAGEDVFDDALAGTKPVDDTVSFSFRDVNNVERHARLRSREQTVDGATRTIVVMHDVTELTEKNQQLEDFASIVTHDLRNPLSVASARVPVVRNRLPDEAGEEVTEHLDVVENSLTRINDLVEGVRTLVRETSVDDLDACPFEETVREAWQTAETENAALAVDAPDTTIVADRRPLLQLLENLFRNARDHAGDDATVTVGVFEDAGFYVADDGPGIPPRDRQRVFDAGYTTDSGGTGLGLKIVREIVTAHDWGISVTESDAGGARFEITGVELD